MSFYEVMRKLTEAPARSDLSAGSPLVPAELRQVLRAGLRRLTEDGQLDLVLSSYDQLDGLETFRDAIAGEMTSLYGRSVSRAEVIAVPGIQVALRYFHRQLSADGRRALYPLGLEFPGCVSFSAPMPATGHYSTTPVGDGTWRPVLDVGSLDDWADVGAVFLSRPHSPTGRDWSSEEITLLAEAADRRGALLVLDETCAPPMCPITLRERLPVDAENLVRLFSFSKLGLAGERVGVAVGPPDVIRRLTKFQRELIIQPPKVGQYLALHLLGALRHRPDLRNAVVRQYQERWAAAHRAVVEVGDPGLRLSRWEGGMFLWLEWDGPPSDLEVADDLLDQGIGVMPGSALFVGEGAPRSEYPYGLRIGLGASEVAIAEAARTAATIIATARRRGFGVAHTSGGTHA